MYERIIACFLLIYKGWVYNDNSIHAVMSLQPSEILNFKSFKISDLKKNYQLHF